MENKEKAIENPRYIKSPQARYQLREIREQLLEGVERGLAVIDRTQKDISNVQGAIQLLDELLDDEGGKTCMHVCVGCH